MFQAGFVSGRVVSIVGRAGTDRALEFFDSAILRLVRNLTFPILLRA